MSKKDYELIARVIREAHSDDERIMQDDQAARLANRFAEELASTNPHFDESRFFAACKGEDSTDSAGRKVRYSNA